MRGIKFQTLHAKNVRTSSMSKTWPGRRPVFAHVPEQVHRMAMDLTALRQTVEQLAASQDQMVREIARLKAADGEILAKVTPAPPTHCCCPRGSWATCSRRGPIFREYANRRRPAS
jgi:hypothetical protein